MQPSDCVSRSVPHSVRNNKGKKKKKKKKIHKQNNRT